MTVPLRERVAAIIKAEAKKYPPGYDLDQGALHLADAVLASEAWQTRWEEGYDQGYDQGVSDSDASGS